MTDEAEIQRRIDIAVAGYIQAHELLLKGMEDVVEGRHELKQELRHTKRILLSVAEMVYVRYEILAHLA